MTVEVIQQFAQFGPAGLLILIGAGAYYLNLKWIIKPREELSRQVALTNSNSQSKMAEALSLLGLQAANTDKGVSTLLVSSQLWEVEFKTSRRAGRTTAEVIEKLADIPSIPPDIKADLKECAGKLYAIWDDGSKEMRAVTDAG